MAVLTVRRRLQQLLRAKSEDLCQRHEFVNVDTARPSIDPAKFEDGDWVACSGGPVGDLRRLCAALQRGEYTPDRPNAPTGSSGDQHG